MPKFNLVGLLGATVAVIAIGVIWMSLNASSKNASDERRNRMLDQAKLQDNSAKPNPTSLVGKLVASEQTILALQDDLDLLSKSAKDLAFAQGPSRALFAPKIKVNSVLAAPAEHADDRFGFQHRTWQTDSTLNETTPAKLKLFDSLFSNTSKFGNFKFKLVKGNLNDSCDLFDGEVSLTALAVTDAGRRKTISGELAIQWKKYQEDDCDCSGWRIVKMSLAKLKTVRGDSEPLFTEVLDDLIVDEAQRARIRRSIHEEACIQLVKTGSAALPVEEFPFVFQYDSTGPHPGLAVVDINGDGWDDLYVMARWGTNQLLVSQGDGTFVEEAAEYGLDVNSHSTSAVFADFDNDGDLDLFLGRYYEPSIYFENQKGWYTKRNNWIDIPMPVMVSSVSAVDYNGDGLLDIYCCTYGNSRAQLEHFLPPAKFKEITDFYANHDTHHIWLHSGGAPNLLLVNRGDGRFGVAPENSQLEFFQTSFQATWADYDQDGDPDVYVCNDYGPDYLMRNDYPDGFKDVTDEIGHQSMKGFGMGATWGDYDLDGQQDLYVSNMYSKAGMRITEQVPGLDEGFRRSADGNRLYRQTPQGFEQVAGLKEPTMQVAKAGWSWGGQFVDFDNDGFLDLYVANGYFTAPDEVAVKVDL